MPAYNPVADTIAAIATPFGPAGIGVIRISGKDAFSVLEKVFNPYSGIMNPKELVLGCLHDEDGENIDEILAVRFPAPRSYTAEDVAELHCHGGSVVMRRALNAVFAAGARQAEGGEFTLRAFLNGRIDLTQAEAVMDIIESKSRVSLEMAESQLQGELYRRLLPLEEDILDLLARVAAAADFPEEVEAIGEEELLERLKALDAAAAELLRGADHGRIYREGLPVVLYGRTNVGKSSLLNALLGEERAIVTAKRGTTRDVIEEYFNLGGLPILLSDTAGLREDENEAADEAEAIGIRRSRNKAEKAALLLYVLAADERPTPAEEAEIRSFVEDHAARKLIFVINKTDIASAEPLMELLGNLFTDRPIVAISAKTGEGLEKLKESVLNLAIGAEAEPPSLLNNARHQEALRNCREHLGAAIETLENGLSVDMAGIDIDEAWQQLGQISGKTAGEDLIGKIFSSFCIGK